MKPRTLIVVDRPDALAYEAEGAKIILRWSRVSGAYTATTCGLHARTNVLIDAILSRPSTHRLRFPLGIRPSMDVRKWGWIETAKQVRSNTRTVKIGANSVDTDAIEPTRPELPLWATRRLEWANPRQGWRRDGTEIVA